MKDNSFHPSYILHVVCIPLVLVEFVLELNPLLPHIHQSILYWLDLNKHLAPILKQIYSDIKIRAPCNKQG